MPNESASAPTAYTGLKVFSRIVLALMVIGMLYVGWLALIYWPEISV